LPSYLLLLERVDSEVPFRVLPLSEAECFYPESKGSLVFTIQATRWQLNFSARDGANRLSWLDALGQVIPVGRTTADGTLSAFRRPRTAPAARYEAISTALVRLRVLQRELGYAEETLEEAQREADAKVAVAAARLQPQGGLFGGHGSWMGRSPAGRSPAGAGPAANGFAIAPGSAPSVADSPLVARRMVQTADGTIALQAPDGTNVAGGASPRWAINVALEKAIVTPLKSTLKELERTGGEIEQQRSHEYFQAQQLVVLNTALRAADGIERLRNGHAGRKADVLRRHHVAGSAFGVAKQCARCCERLRAERLQDPPRDFCWQIIKQRDAVIGSHGVHKLKHLLA
jgi:hypothetical protein